MPPTIGPAAIGRRGPTLAVNAPKRGESTKSMTDTGTEANPAARGV